MVATILQDALFVVVTTTIHATRANRDILDLSGMDSLTTLCAVFPVLVYPFLPSTGLLRIPCSVFLIWPSMLGLTHLYTAMAMAWIGSCGQPSEYLWQPWQVTLMWLSLLAGFEGLHAHGRGKPRREDLRTSAMTA